LGISILDTPLDLFRSLAYIFFKLAYLWNCWIVTSPVVISFKDRVAFSPVDAAHFPIRPESFASVRLELVEGQSLFLDTLPG